MERDEVLRGVADALGLKEGVDYGEWTEHLCHRCDYHDMDGTEIGAKCMRCGREFNKYMLRWRGEKKNCEWVSEERFAVDSGEPCRVLVADYIGDPVEAQGVLDWLTSVPELAKMGISFFYAREKVDGVDSPCWAPWYCLEGCLSVTLIPQPSFGMAVCMLCIEVSAKVKQIEKERREMEMASEKERGTGKDEKVV